GGHSDCFAFARPQRRRRFGNEGLWASPKPALREHGQAREIWTSGIKYHSSSNHKEPTILKPTARGPRHETDLRVRTDLIVVQESTPQPAMRPHPWPASQWPLEHGHPSGASPERIRL